MMHGRLRAIWLWGAAAVSIILVLATAAHQLRPWDPAILDFVFATLNLGAENNVGAAWSGALLMLVAVHAFDGHVRQAGRDPAAARGWAWIALVLLALSADELASLHERVGLYGASVGFGSWRALLPFAVVLGAMLGYGLVMLARSKSERSKAPYLLLGFFLLSTGALHEVVEHRVHWATPGVRALRVALEEGSELGGMLILLTVAAGNTAGLSATRGLDAGPAFEAVRRLRWPLLGLALALTPLLAYATVALEDSRGRLASWAAALVFLAGALAACRPYFATRAEIEWDRWILCALSGLALVAVVDVHPSKTIEIGPFDVGLRLFIVATIILSVCAISLWHAQVGIERSGSIAASISAALGGALLSASLLGPVSPFLVYVLSQLAALAVFAVIVAGTETRTGSLPYTLETAPRSRG